MNPEFPIHSGELPLLTVEQMIEVDRAMIEDFHISLTQMMENAGRNLAHLARIRFLSGNPSGKSVLILAGSGGNGGGALVCARRLNNWGANVRVYLSKPENEFVGVPQDQISSLKRMNVKICPFPDTNGDFVPDLIIDGLIGYSLKGAPYGTIATMIEWANRQNVSILALDTPSGLDLNNGAPSTSTIRATATMTLALPKTGLMKANAISYVGELYLADISVPPTLYSGTGLSLRVNLIFATSDIIRLR